jgi:hypothetical protein
VKRAEPREARAWRGAEGEGPYFFRPTTSGPLDRTCSTAHLQARPYFVTVLLEPGARSPGIAGLSFAQRRQVAIARGVTGMMQAKAKLLGSEAARGKTQQHATPSERCTSRD